MKKLNDYMQQHGISDADMAVRLRITRQAVSAYRRGKRTPRPEIMRRIVEVTGGAVRPDDFYLQEEMKS